MSDRAGGAAEWADVGLEDWAADQALVVLEGVAQVESLILPVVLAKHAAVELELLDG